MTVSQQAQLKNSDIINFIIYTCAFLYSDMSKCLKWKGAIIGVGLNYPTDRDKKKSYWIFGKLNWSIQFTGKIDIVRNSKIPVDGSNAPLRMPAAVLKHQAVQIF